MFSHIAQKEIQSFHCNLYVLNGKPLIYSLAWFPTTFHYCCASPASLLSPEPLPKQSSILAPIHLQCPLLRKQFDIGVIMLN